MRVLVTGGSGYLGSHIADALTAAGHKVVIFDRVESPWRSPQQELLVGDLGNRDDVARAVEGADVIYHLGGFADLNAARTRPIDTVHANILGTVHLLEAARALELQRFVFASTVYVYSREGGFYRCSKQACESYIEEYSRSFGVPYTILRYGSLYGPRSNMTNGVHRLLAQAMNEGVVNFTGDPDDVREYIHVEDAAKLSVDILAPEFADKHVMLTGNTALRAHDLFTMFGEILGKDVEVRYRDAGSNGSGHYSITPYTFTPKPGRKLSCNHFVNMGQGILQLVEQLHNKGER